MARETKEQRQAREARELVEYDLRVAEYRKTIPAKLVMMQAIAAKVGVPCTVTLTDSGPEVYFRKYEYNSTTGREDCIIDHVLRYDSEEWEIESTTRKLNEIKDEQDAKAARLKMAQDHFSTLSPELKAAIKENICRLK